MDNSFFPRTWRGREKASIEELSGVSVGESDLLLIKGKFVEVITTFIRSIFNYEKIEVGLNKRPANNANTRGYSNSTLVSANNHAEFQFAEKLFDDQFYEFSITNIPVTADSRHIKIFFDVLQKYIYYFNEIVETNMPIEDGILKASPNFVSKCEIWLYNIERTIIVEYVFHLFNTFDATYSNEFRLAPRPIRYNLDLVNNILDFAIELSTKKIENKEIYCGFIFHDNTYEIEPNSMRSIRFNKQFDFGDFGKLKNYLEISNGQNIFFNVTDEKVTHIFITREKLNEIHMNPIGDGKSFQKRPLILSVQGNGKIYFLEGRPSQTTDGQPDHNRILLQIINSKPVIRDDSFIKKFILDCLKEFSTDAVEEEQVDLFAKWIMSLSQKKHGTSLIFKNITDEIEASFVKTVKIIVEPYDYLGTEYRRYDLSLLDNIVNPDGAVVFARTLIPSHISTILPIGQTAAGTSGGARHNSVANFTREFDCLGIVISEDGPITIFKNGEKLIKF